MSRRLHSLEGRLSLLLLLAGLVGVLVYAGVTEWPRRRRWRGCIPT